MPVHSFDYFIWFYFGLSFAFLPYFFFSFFSGLARSLFLFPSVCLLLCPCFIFLASSESSSSSSVPVASLSLVTEGFCPPANWEVPSVSLTDLFIFKKNKEKNKTGKWIVQQKHIVFLYFKNKRHFGRVQTENWKPPTTWVVRMCCTLEKNYLKKKRWNESKYDDLLIVGRFRKRIAKCLPTSFGRHASTRRYCWRPQRIRLSTPGLLGMDRRRCGVTSGLVCPYVLWLPPTTTNLHVSLQKPCKLWHASVNVTRPRYICQLI